MKYLNLLILCLILVSCGDLKSDEDDDKVTDREFQNTEVSAANSICEALKDKKNYFELLVDGDYQLRFNLDETKCTSTRQTNTSSFLTLRVPFGGEIYWEGTRGATFFNDVVTEESRPLEYICTEIFAGKTPRTVKLVGNIKYHFNFKADENFGYVTIKTLRKKDDSESYELIDQEGLKIVTLLSTRNTNPRLYGVVVDRDKARGCSNGNTYRLRQTKI